jgi:uncharacterized protein YbjT (DUF2867 family)
LLAALESPTGPGAPSHATRTALIVGATGLVGGICLRRLLEEPRYAKVVAIARRPLPLTHSKLHVELADLRDLDGTAAVPCDDLYCALGTTIAKAGSKDAFRAVDHHMVVGAARYALRGGATRAALVSSAGADRPGANFYLKVKAETEAALTALPFRAVHILRPGLLLGPRTESRPAEAFFRAIAPAFNLLLLGPLRRYRAIPAADVACAMARTLFEHPDGPRALHYDEMMRLARE